ncbi:signal recognition particle 19 kDa protein-like [Eriocheir sinensis]|uniref:signal recognition particle 19 kDa protein-like n=1 Tax=Eriocheir sinensis TaxID=95602 RepID=UPI0021C574A9|nr:signal recognition particle 19 kDa protein-like [Eriocheir sinensis]
MAAAAAAPRPVPKLPDGYDRWACLYPAYINKDKSRAEGRRIPKDKAVSAPTCKEMLDVLSTSGLQVIGERKIYCREKSKEPPFWGRVRVQLKSPAGELVNPKFSTRDDVMLYAAEKIPQLKSRTNPKHTQDSGQQQGKQGKGKKRK